MTTQGIKYAALQTAGRIIHSGQSRSLLLTGNIDDLYYDPRANGGQGDYVPLIDFLTRVWNAKDLVVVTYQLNGPVRFQNAADLGKMLKAWVRYHCPDIDPTHSSSWKDDKKLERHDAARKQFLAELAQAQENPSFAFELLRRMCISSREAKEPDGALAMPENLRIIVEGADMHLPEAEVSRMSEGDRRRVGICQDWFSDPAFQRGGDAVVLLAETRGAVNSRIARLPQIIGVELPAPDEGQRQHCIDWFNKNHAGAGPAISMAGDVALAKWTAGLSVHALVQLLRGAAAYEKDRQVSSEAVTPMVESYIKAQLGDDVVEFKNPVHGFEAIKGNTRLKKYLQEEVIPRCSSLDDDVISSILVPGPVGSGKTFIMEAVAASLGRPVMELKNIRSQWFGQTDVIMNRLCRVLSSLSRVCIFIDEADTQFGDISTEQHSTEKRVSGAILRLMSDPRFKGRILWLLMTARPHLLPPDMMREGRGGNLVIPILDPSTDEDRREFLEWVFLPVLADGADKGALLDQLSASERLQSTFKVYSADSYRLLRSELKARKAKLKRDLGMKEIIAVVEDIIPPDIALTRRFQTLQALVKCTRKSLLPAFEGDLEAQRLAWRKEIGELEALGIR